MADNRPFLDFKAIKARAGIADILARYRVRLNRANKTTLKGDCPLPTHSSASKNTFFVNETKAVWYCHSDSCKKNGNRAGGNVIDFVALMEGLSIYAAAKRIDEMVSVNGRSAAPGEEHDVRPESVTEADDCNKPLAFSLKDVNPVHPMIQERGISVTTARVFGIGFFPGKGSMAERIVFPLHEHGNLVGYAGRTTLPVSDGNPKWIVGKGLRKSFLYGIEHCNPAKPVILVESFWGPPFFHEMGSQAAALMGSELTYEQERCLDQFSVVTVALDNDAAGMAKAARICERLKRQHRVMKARLIE
jgi:DNA primase